MLFGADLSATDYSFLNAVTAQNEAAGEVEYVHGFNEPDGESDCGGSNIPLQIVAKTWIGQMEPLSKVGVNLGAPAGTGTSSGFTWLRNLFSSVKLQLRFHSGVFGMAVSRAWLATRSEK